MNSSVVNVTICIATYRRPAMLKGLLESLCLLEAPLDSTVGIVVVDNDVEASARDVVEAARSSLGFPLEYVVEPTRNISLARNRGVARALELGADFVAFVDDDEVVRENWLVSLLAAQREFSSSAVCGPVYPRYPDDVPRWVIAGGFFEPRSLGEGKPIDFGMTCNALVSASLLDTPPFDPAFGISGGGDAQFFMRVRRDGASIVWTDAAVVEEVIPRSRARSGWILRRSFRVGHAYVRCRRSLFPMRTWLISTVGAAIGRIGAGSLLAILALPRGRAPLLRALRTLSHGVGALVALTGIRYEEYTAIHGG